ncbi:putative membrane-bound dehydrogenase-like protein [Prosthecobacter fusiformis]|uniref:Putative membrane-bound dehydrogenase-like protein n=1 Tax=Prosthecobacter fusiformis TaxID=48464 RepID=A0A4R7SR10_9BACT|nr:PVC-type heme-binding CxxCH protein [Prosthecobacter fusiformis]TDU81115.1 putative membrane-bound dehydrogenase-like protein [Prosthecobacter fusiformis]
MKRFLQQAAILLSSFAFLHLSVAADPLRVFIRGGKKTHAPGAHEHEQFLKDWLPLLNERGAKASGGLDFPTKEQLDNTDVLILHAQEAGNIQIGEQRKNLMTFLQRGGGLVVIHAAAVSRDHDWFKSIIGGSWNFSRTKWLEAPMSLYFTDRDNPITQDISNFDLDDEIYYDMDMLPEVKILAAAYTPKAADTGGKGNKEAQQRAAEAVAKKKAVNIYDIQPQMWTYEKANYRAFTCIPGHWYKNFSHVGLRTAILRGIAWAGKRANVDELCKPEELGDALRYAEGGVPRPQEMPKHLEIHPEFELSLVAAEPLINKPMNLDWDEKGRLWVVETPEYPNGLRQSNVEAWKDSGSIKPGEYQREPLDRVSILTDTDGDGVMDKKQVFADKIELATSSVFYKNGIIVCAAPDIWFFEDTDGDDKADKRSKLYTNLGNRDTHAVINNMRWGLDGWVYATHGYSSTEDARSGDGGKGFGPIGAGVVRFKPDGSAIEQYASRGGNTWGLDITAGGEVFYTQPTSGNHFIHVVLPEYVLAKGKLPGVMGTNGMLPKEPAHPAMNWEQQAYVQIDQVGSYTAAAGCAIYEGGAWPEKWNYGYFTTEPTLNIVSHFMVEPDGVTYKAHREPGREQTEFIRSTNLWFRPIEVRTGPDGALYVVDFCNQAIIHNDTRGPTHGPANAAVRPDRDHYYGRIWKVQHKLAKKVTKAVTYRANAEPKAQGSAAEKAYETAAAAVESSAGRTQALKDFSAAKDDWTRSALIAACMDQPLTVIEAALADSSLSGVEPLITALLPSALPAHTEKLIALCASATASADHLKITILSGIAQELKDVPALTPALTESLKKLLAQPSLAAAALPLVAKLDADNKLQPERKAVIQKLMALMKDVDAPVQDRLAAVAGLLGASGRGSADDFIAESAMELDRKKDPAAANKEFANTSEYRLGIIRLIGDRPDAYVAPRLMDAYVDVEPEMKAAIFEVLIKRPEWTREVLSSVKKGLVPVTDFAPGDIARMRSHPNKGIAREANELFKINNAAKDGIIAKLIPEVEKPGNVANGKMLFSAACAVCHKLGDIGAPVGPPLDGMGAHGPAELLVHIVDPNREVDPSFWAFNVITKKGEALQGVVTSENSATVTLATQVGVREIAKTDIEKKENTRRSLMPEGLEALGPDALRDILAYICGDAMKQFRILHLADVYTADSRGGIFAGPASNQGQVRLSRYGNLQIENVPFFVQDASKNATGANLIVLKGGPPKSQSSTYPDKVEVPVNVATKRLQLLSGISGWGWPAVKAEVPALKATVVYESGEKEEFTFLNGVHFSDYVRNVEVPGSKFVPGITDGQQMRLLSIELSKKGVVKTLLLESPEGNPTAPVIVAITADIEGKGPAAGSTDTSTRPQPQPKAGAPKKGKGKGPGMGSVVPSSGGINAPAKAGTKQQEPKTGGKGDGPLVPANSPQWEAGKTKVLVIGGGSSHNFATFFGTTDVVTLKNAGFSVHYTEDRDQAATELANADVAIISVNRKFFDTAAYRKALMDFASAGKGIIMFHPGTWYGYATWPELNAQIVGGGARGHDKIHPFDVKTVKAHPIMEGVPASFKVEDELYYVNAEPEKTPAGTSPIEVLAETSPSDKFNKPHPSIWITQHPTARIVGIALGHDERVHDLEAFKKILTNAARWASGK